MTTRLPFTFTPQISRYITEIIKDYNKRIEGVSKKEKITPFPVFFKTYKEEEYVTKHAEEMRLNFVNYLIKKQAVESLVMPKQVSKDTVKDQEFYNEITDEEFNDTTRFFIKNFGLRILDIKPIQAIFEHKLKHSNPTILTEVTELEDSRLGQCVENNENGKPKVKLSFGKNKERHYYKPVLRRMIMELWARRSHICKGKESNGRNAESISIEKLAEEIEIKNKVGMKMLHTQLHNTQNELLKKFSGSILLVEIAGKIQIKVKED
jgi:hypothetical protein